MKKVSKRILQLSVLAFLGVTAVGANTLWTSLEAAVKSLPDGFTVTAHTGCEGTRDNSLESISAGYAAGADIVEFDLRFDAEGKGILSHDEDEKNPVTLEAALEAVASYESLRVNVDCKTTDNLSEVFTLGEQYGITDRLF